MKFFDSFLKKQNKTDLITQNSKEKNQTIDFEEGNLDVRKEDLCNSVKIGIIDECLSGLASQIIEALEKELLDFRKKANSFYQSPESRVSINCVKFWEEQISIRNRAGVEAGIHFLNRKESTKALSYIADNSRYDSSPSDFYAHIRYEILSQYELLSLLQIPSDKLGLNPIRNRVGDAGIITLEECEREWGKAVKEAVKTHWSPIFVLKGVYGSYTNIICFDTEFGIYFQLTPDDNFYHWGDYEMNVISEDRIDNSILDKSLHNSISSNDSASYFEYGREITARIINQNNGHYSGTVCRKTDTGRA